MLSPYLPEQVFPLRLPPGGPLPSEGPLRSVGSHRRAAGISGTFQGFHFFFRKEGFHFFSGVPLFFQGFHFFFFTSCAHFKSTRDFESVASASRRTAINVVPDLRSRAPAG